MFEDFKTQVMVHNQNSNRRTNNSSPLAKSKQSAIDADLGNLTLTQLFPEFLDEDSRTDLSLMSGAEFDIMATYGKLRKYLVEKYPTVPEESKRFENESDKPLGEPLQIDVSLARMDPKAKQFLQLMLQVKVIYEKLEILQKQASDYEKICLRLYWHLTYNWRHAPNTDDFRKCLLDSDIFEIVEAYFKVCQKYHVPVFEEPYYFLTDEQRREVKLAGDVLRRTTEYSDNEICISILEAFQ